MTLTQKLKEELREYIRNNVRNFDVRYDLALDIIGESRCNLEYADRSLADDIQWHADEWRLYEQDGEISEGDVNEYLEQEFWM